MMSLSAAPARHDAEGAPFLHGTLDAEDADGPHGGGSDDADEQTFDNKQEGAGKFCEYTVHELRDSL